MRIKIHYLQHVPFEDPGFIQEWVAKKAFPHSSTKFFENGILPQLTEFDWLIIMGGPMGVYDHDKFPWLKDEIAFIQNAIANKKVVIGICLGAQLIANALGSNVYPGSKKEIGWFPIQKTNSGELHPILNKIPTSFSSFHWHGDTFDLPIDSVHLLESVACKNQSFLYGDRVLGLQFHLEVTKNSLAGIIENCRDELQQDTFIQSESEILNQSYRIDVSNSYMESILEYLLGNS